MLFTRILSRLFTSGDLTFIDPLGNFHRFAGEPIAGLSPVVLKLNDPALDWPLSLHPMLTVGEAYMNGQLTVEQGGIYDFLALASYNLDRPHGAITVKLTEGLSFLWRHLQQYNPPWRARRNAAHHYDLSVALYDLFLDRDRQYSCAYFESPTMTLDEAQRAKRRHIMAKLLIKPGHRVLDIGCGWGGMALTLAQEAGARVTGISLSEQQVREARLAAERAGLSDRTTFLLTDYRQVAGSFDRIVSVGMFEHVGIRHYRAFFETVRDRLSDDGVALIHFICRSGGPGTTNPWIRKYIFPGGYSPALSEVWPAIEKSGLYVTDAEFLRLHYAETLRAWRQRFLANWDRAAALYDQRFCRMWEFYLAGSEIAFRQQGHYVIQIQLAKRIDGVPLTRGYIEEKAGLRENAFL